MSTNLKLFFKGLWYIVSDSFVHMDTTLDRWTIQMSVCLLILGWWIEYHVFNSMMDDVLVVNTSLAYHNGVLLFLVLSGVFISAIITTIIEGILIIGSIYVGEKLGQFIQHCIAYGHKQEVRCEWTKRNKTAKV